jgi:serine phosphatase RsbU (regulator of sigma subunit)
MSNLIQRVIKNSSARILFLVYLGVLALVAYFLITGYNKQLSAYQTGELNRLNGIVSTLLPQIDVDSYENLLVKYSRNTGQNIERDSNYRSIRDILLNAARVNGLKEDAIYILHYDSLQNNFHFGAMSGKSYWGNSWNDFNELHIEKYLTGGVVPAYKDGNGVWLSAFVPLKSKKGNQIGILQVDQQFDAYIETVRKEIYSWLVISSIVVLMILFFLIYTISDLLKKEENYTEQLQNALSSLQRSNRDILDSITYARRIQDAILPAKELLSDYFGESFIFYQPLDILSGDFFWIAEHDDRIYIAAVDCTGHGVPGALMSIIGSVSLNEIVKNENVKSPSVILDHLENRITSAIYAHEKKSRDGMDIGLISICLKSNMVDYSGAIRPLIIVKDTGIDEIKADRFSIGGGIDIPKKEFSNHSVQLGTGDSIYLFTDGYVDQIGGLRNKRIGSKRLRGELEKMNELSFMQRKKYIEQFWSDWKGKNSQTDDVLMIGIQL